MKYYKILQNDEGHIEVVKMGWSWPAFFFTLFWAISKKLWKAATILVAIVIVLYFGISTILSIIEASTHKNELLILINLLNIVFIFTPFVFGFKANDLLEMTLLKKGYKLKKVTTADSPSQAYHFATNNQSK